MLKLLLLSVVVCTTYAAWYEESAKRFQGKRGRFTMGYNKAFSGWSLEQVKSLMGTRLDKKAGVVHPVKTHEDINLNEIPATFNSRDKWPKCGAVFDFIKDQSACGSCWAVAASNVIAARICIVNYDSMSEVDDVGIVGLNEPKTPIDMSAEQILSCCNFCGDGCKGGYPIDAYRYWLIFGVVTGGWYGSNCGCYPYDIAPCPNGCEQGPTPNCRRVCRSGYGSTQAQDKHMGTDYYEILPMVPSLMTEIMTVGPIECSFKVYENFMSYTSGIYDEIDGLYLGGHAVTIVGWGVENDVPFWIINNSWNSTWGMQGTFKFLRGTNLAGMETQCVAGTAQAKDSNFMLKC